MAVARDFWDFILQQLEKVPTVSSRAMFGAVGLYSGGIFFGLIDNDQLYFRVDDTTRPLYEELGSGPFEYAPGKIMHRYYLVPEDILESGTKLTEWADAAIAAALRNSSKPKPRRSGKK